VMILRDLFIDFLILPIDRYVIQMIIKVNKTAVGSGFDQRETDFCSTFFS